MIINNNSNIEWDEFEYRKNPKIYHNSYSKSRLEQIYNIIRIWTIRHGGISHGELSKQVKLYRKNLTKYLDKLLKDNLIIREKPDTKRGKYLVKDQEIINNMDYVLISNILTDKFKDILFRALRKNDYCILNNKYSNSMIFSDDAPTDNNQIYHFYDFSKYKQYFEPKFKEKTLLEKNIFEISNLIGSFIIYFIIQSRNLLVDHNNNNNNKKSNIIIDKEEIANRFIEKGTLSILKIVRYWMQFLDAKNNSNVLSAFSNLYPLLNYELEKILTPNFRTEFIDIMRDWSSSSRLETYKEYQKNFTDIREKQKNCKHEYILYLQSSKNGVLTKVKQDNNINDYLPTKKDKNESDTYVKICSICNHKKIPRLKRESK